MKARLLFTAVLLGVFATLSSAAPLTGTLFFTGDARVFSDAIDWKTTDGSLEGPGGITSNMGFGDFDIQPSSTGNFAAWNQDSDDGEIKDLAQAFAPVGAPISVQPFLMFDARPDVVFELTLIRQGSFGPCVGGPICSVNQFNLVEGTDSVNVFFEVSGNVYDDTGLINFFTGSFAQTFNREDENSIAELLGKLSTQGFVDASYTANINVAPIPEPGTITLFGMAGAMFAASAAIRRFRK